MKKEFLSLLNTTKIENLDEELNKAEHFSFPVVTWLKGSDFKKAARHLKTELLRLKQAGQDKTFAAAMINFVLGDGYMRKGKLESAEIHLLKSVEIWAEQDSDNFRATIHKILDLMQDYEAEKNLKAAENLGRIILKLVKKNLSEGDSLIVSVLTDLGVTLQAQEKHSEAEDIYHEALNQSENNTKTLHGFGPRILMNLAGVETFHRDLAQAEVHLDHALRIAHTAKKTHQAHVLEIFLNKARVYFGQNDKDKFDRAVTQAMQASEEAWGDDPDLVIECLLDFIRLHEAMDRHDIAARIASHLTEAIDKEWYHGNETKYSALTQVFVQDLLRKGVPRAWETALPVFHFIEPNITADRQ